MPSSSPYSYAPLPSRSASQCSQQSIPSSPVLAVAAPPSNSLRSRKRNAVPVTLALVAGLTLLYCFAPAESVDAVQQHISNISAPIAKLVHPAECDPFSQYGQLEVVIGEPDQNLWRPWDETCRPSTLLTAVRNRLDMPWLRNRTVAVIGDSIDRDHVEYFCELAKGEMEWVWEGSRYSPYYTYSDSDSLHYNASENGQADGGAQQSRPRICRVEQYNFTVVFTFHFGLSEGSEKERQMAHFYPPFEFTDRLNEILVPILENLDKYPPSLVEFSSGSWDLQHWTLEDRETDADRLAALSTDRTNWYRPRFVNALQTVEKAFPSSRTALVLREMQHTKLTDTVPPPRVHGLQNLQALLLQQEIKARGRWQLDPIGRLLLGQEHNFRDSVHPNIYPAGKLWGDIMLHKLKTHVESF